MWGRAGLVLVCLISSAMWWFYWKNILNWIDKGLQAWRPHLLILMVLHRPGHCLPLQRPTFRKGVSIAYSCADWQQGATVRFRLGQGRRSTLHFLGSWHLKCILCPSGGERGEGRGSWHKQLEAHSPQESFQPSCLWGEAVPSVHARFVQRAHAP